jgi:hypothetical protein
VATVRQTLPLPVTVKFDTGVTTPVQLPTATIPDPLLLDMTQLSMLASTDPLAALDAYTPVPLLDAVQSLRSSLAEEVLGVPDAASKPVPFPEATLFEQ